MTCAVRCVVFRVILTFALLVVFGMQLVKLPHLIKGNKIVTMVMVFMQLVIFVFLLAALGNNVWSNVNYSAGGFGTVNINFGATKVWGSTTEQEYADYCTGANGQKINHTRCGALCILVSDPVRSVVSVCFVLCVL